MAVSRVALWCVVLLVVKVICSSGQQCTPASNSQGMILPNTDLPNQGVRLYFQEASEPIPDFLMLRASQLEPDGFNNMSPTRALWCQSANNNSNNGTWFQPPGSTVVSSMDIDGPPNVPYQMVTCPGQVGLVRDIGLADTDNIGLVQCVIRDEMNTTHTLTAGVYTGGIYDNYVSPIVDTNMQFALTSSRDADSPVFTLSFDSSNGPPTVVNCTRGGQALDTSLYTVSREVLQTQYVQNGEVDSLNASEPDMPDVTRVTVTVMEREAGNYECNVTVMGRNDNTPTQVVTLGTPASSTLMITVAGTPTNVAASRSSATEVTVMWDALSPPPDGYEVFYQVDGGGILSAGTTTNTTLAITGVTVVQEISCFVVAFVDTDSLPSARSSVVIVQPGFSITSFSSSGTNLVGSGNFTITCVGDVTQNGVESLNVTIQDPSNMVLASMVYNMPMTGESYPVSYTFNLLGLSDTGAYTCALAATLNTIANADQNLTIEVFEPEVTVTQDNPNPFVAGSKRSLICSVPEGLTVTLKWTKDGNPVTVDSRVTVNTTSRSSTLMFNVLRTSDGGNYNCILCENGTNSSTLITLNVTIPNGNVTVIQPSTPLVEGNPADITCNVAVSEDVDTPINITRQWLGPGVLTDGPDYTIFNDTLRINQLNVSRDNEQIITCMVVILPLSEYVLQSGTSSVDTQLTVRAPGVIASIDSMGSPLIAGTSRSLLCFLDSSVTFTAWMRNGSPVNTSDSRVTVTMTSSNSTLTISPLCTSDGGQYQCMGSVRINGVPTNVTDEINLNVTISISSVTVTTIPNDTLYVDTFSDFQCNATISEYVDTPTTITFQWLGPSLLTTGADYNITGDTLHIKRFNMTRDNGRTITCMATVLPSSGQQYVLQNNASVDTQLTVAALSDAVFTPRFIILVPTAGDNFNLICRLDGVVERLAVTPAAVTLTFISSPGGTRDGEQSQIEPFNIYIRPREFEPLKTDDVGTYRCRAIVDVIVDVTFLSSNAIGVLMIKIPPPQLTLTITPSNTTTLYEGTPVNLTCTTAINTTIVNTAVTVSSMWIAPNGEQLTSSSSDRITIVDMLQSAPYTSVLMFDPADGMDTGGYQCIVNVVQNSGQPLILPSSSNATTNLNVTALPDPIIDVTTVGSTEAGQTFSLVCTVTMATKETPRPTVTWIKVTGNSTTFPAVVQNITSLTITSTISFFPLTFSHRGQYRCMVTLNISTIYTFAGNEDYNISVNFPPPTVVVQPVNPVPMVAGTAHNLTCTINLTNVDDINMMVNFIWSTPMGILLSSHPRITTISGTTQSANQSSFTSVLSISPLDSVADTTVFTCLVNVNSDPADSFIIPTSANNTVDITVQPLLPPTVMTTSSGDMSPGSTITLTCTVGVVDGLIVQPDIVWAKQAVSAGGNTALNSISVGAMKTDNTVTLTFNTTNTSDAGQYTCTATVDITAINITVTNNSMVDIRLQIQSPTVSLTLSSASGNVLANSSTSQSYFAGSTLTITCVIDIPLTVNTPFEVDMEWSMDGDDDFDTSNVGSGSTAGSRIDITTATETMSNRYQTQLVFSTLSSSMDSGSYECSIGINSNDSLLYVNDSALVNESTTVSVQDPPISNFTVAPTMVAVLESTCPDSDPHDSFTLVCRARKPAVVIPQLMVQWLQNGSMRAGDLSVSDNGAYVVNTLNDSEAEVSDAGLYQCVATIMIPDSPTVTTNASSTVDSRASSVPNTPDVSITTINPTDATITITVSSIAYTRETYYIQYSRQERDTDLAQSDNVSGTADIIATNSTYTITLSDLEEDTTYNYTVTASNCIGNTTTATMSFRTLSTVPAAPPMNCNSSTFFSTNATLQWMPPPPIDQNGAITGYSLTCPDVTTNLDSTLNSSLTTITILSGVVPFRNYSCVLAAINVNGTSPNTTTCSFETAQDTPGDPPNNFTVMVSMRSLWYRWTPPTLPNGIITGYTLVAVETQPLDATIRSYLLCGLTPNQAVTATIRASTIIGQGPPQTLMRTTTALANTGVANLRATGPIATTLDITWAAPTTPHGFVNRYMVTVDNKDTTTGTTTLVDVTAAMRSVSVFVPSLTTSFSGLAGGVPYYVTVTPWDRCNIPGDAMNTTVFTQQLPALRAPEYTTDRSLDGTTIMVNWTPLTLEETRGFITYRVVLTPTVNNKRQSGITQTVSMDQSSVTFNMLDPALPYTVAVGVVNNNITDGVVNPHPSNIVTATAVPPGPPIGIIAGVIVVVILAIIAAVVVAIIIVVLWKRHQERTGIAKFKDSMFQVEATPTVRPLVTSDVSLEVTNGDTVALTEVGNKNAEAEDEGETETRMDEEMVLEHMKPIAKASFNEHVQQMHVNSDAGFEKEYQSVQMQIPGITFATSGLDCNKSKNRFANIFPYDHNRVQMAVQDGADGTDYVNASFVDGYAHVGAYIAAQGPLPTTIGDFWRMIWEYKATDVVMLTGVVEAGKKKCEQYWPDKVGETLDPHNGLMVTMISHVPFSDFIIRNLKLAKPGDESAKTLDITHYHFTAWPDHGVPQFATSLISFIGRIQKKHKKDAKIPLLVHCSAGVGRTSTFIMLDTMMDRLKNEDSINVYEFLHQMRKQRMHMVQTQPQYVFIHDALDELITCGETDIAASNLRARVNKMHKIVPGKNMSGFQDQFQLLEQVCYKPGEAAFTDSTQPYNLPKNRYPDKLPFNVSRPRLRPDGTSGSDYINGNFVDGYKQRNAYIVTQGPLKGTVNDLWQMMWEFKSRAIVMLCNTVEEGEEKCYQYWPLQKDEYIEFGKLKVTLQSEDVHEQYVVRKLHVCNEKGSKQDKDGVVVTQLHYTAWPEHGHPSATVHIIEMMELLTRVQMKSGNKPITVLCNDGIGRSGAFLCIHSQLERLKTDGEVDAFKYLKTARTRRQGLIAELDHYVFCHEVLADYVESFDPYANFKDV